MADQEQVSQQQQQEQQQAASVSKAAEGARIAAEASRYAWRIHSETRENIAASSLQDLKLPCIPVSPSGFAQEQRRTVAADVVIPSPYTAVKRQPTFGIPTPETVSNYDELSQVGLRCLEHHHQITLADAKMIEKLVANSTAISRLDLSRGLDEFQKPPIPADLLNESLAQVENDMGPETEESTERLQAMLEKYKQEFTTYDAGLKFLAERSLDRYEIIVKSLLKNYSVAELNLANNHLGATDPESGRALYQPLRRLGKVLDETSKLTHVDLSGNQMGPQGVGIIAKAMTKNITITSLNLSGNEICVDAPDEEDDPDAEEEDPVFGEFYQNLESLSELLKKNKFLKILSLRNNGIKGEIDVEGEDDGAETPLGKFLEPFKKYHRLETLDLSGNELGPGGAKQLSLCLGSNHSIRTLDVSDNQLGIVGLGFIAKLLESNQIIRSLMLQKNDMLLKRGKKGRKQGLDVLSSFAAALQQNHSLTELNLSGHHFGVEACQHLLTGFEQSRITHLYFDSNDLCGTTEDPEPDVTALQQLLAAVGRTEQPLKVLSLAGNRLMVKGALALAESGAPCALHTLNVARNVLGDEGAAAIMNSLTTAELVVLLQDLDLSHNQISQASVFASTISKAASITSLNLSANRVGDNSEDFCEFVRQLGGEGTMLRAINLESNNIGHDEASSYALIDLCGRAIAPFNSLNLMDNPKITLQVAKQMIEALANNNSIRCLRVSSQAGDRHALVDTALKCLEHNSKLTDLDLCCPMDTEDQPLMNLQHRLLKNALQGVDIEAAF